MSLLGRAMSGLQRLNELARQVEPGELARALSDDARKRGL
jgi:hypothetical protein